MNWKLIFSLSLFGVAMGFASLTGWTQGIEWLLWLLIYLVSAWFIAQKAPAKHFLHGFVVGLLNGIVHAIIQAAFFDTYLASNAQVAEQFGNIPGGLPPLLFVLLSGPFIGVISGGILGLFAVIMMKLIKKDTTPTVAN